MKIAVTSNSFSFNIELRSRLNSLCEEVKFKETKNSLDQKSLIDYLQDYDFAIIGLDKINAEVLDSLPNLKMISKYGVGLDNIDVEECKKRNIKIGWTPGLNKESVSEITLGFMISLSRNINTTCLNLKNGTWHKDGGKEISEQTIGVIGVGNIGQELIKKLQPFSSNIIANDIEDKSDFLSQYGIPQVSKEEIFFQADIISIHTPLTEQTENLISKSSLSKCKDDVIIINTARGKIINEIDIYKFIKKGKVKGLAIDVYEEEPAINNKLTQLDQVLCTPHIAGNSNRSVLKMGHSAIDHISEAIRNEK